MGTEHYGFEYVASVNNVNFGNDTVKFLEDIDGKIYENGIHQKVINKGQGQWSWIKYSDGRAKAWMEVTATTEITMSWGSGYLSRQQPSVTYPAGLFSSIPAFRADIININSVINAVHVEYDYDGSATKTPTWFLWRGVSTTSATYTIMLVAEGYWN